MTERESYETRKGIMRGEGVISREVGNTEGERTHVLGKQEQGLCGKERRQLEMEGGGGQGPGEGKNENKV